MTPSPTTADPAARVWDAIATVSDPEIPILSVVELGIIDAVDVDGDHVKVRMLPTFVGCPALDLMRSQITAAIHSAGFPRVDVEVAFDPPWTSDRISPDGRERLRQFGVAPPAGSSAGTAVESNFHRVPCPRCGGRDTRLESLFGPTLCRAIHYCGTCRESFEHFKPVG